MEALENDQRITHRVLALSQLLATALQPEEWAALASSPPLESQWPKKPFPDVTGEKNHFDAEEVEP